MKSKNERERTSSMLDCKHNILHKPILLKMEKEIINYWRKFSWKWRRIWNRMPVISFIISGVNSFPLWNYLHLFYYLTRRCYVYFLLLIPISFQLFKNKKKEIEKSWYRKIPRNKNIWIHCWHIQKMKRERQASNNHTKIKIRNKCWSQRWLLSSTKIKRKRKR